jgi:PST family polysaccharide transporter
MKIDKQILKNFASLMTIQIGNYLIPLVQTPYLVRVLGTASFGRVGFAMAATQYIVALADYGFNLTATRKLAVCRLEGDRKVAEVFWGVIWTKAMLALIGSIVLMACIFAFPKLNQYALIMYPFFFWAWGTTMFPVWYFQGIEKMGTMTAVNMTAKVLVLPLTLIFIHKPSDGFLYAAIFSAVYFIAGLIGIYVAVKEVRFFFPPKPRQIWEELHTGASMFAAMVGYNIYSNTNAVIIGLTVGDVAVGLFVGAEKFLRAALGILGPVHSAIYPRLSASAVSSKKGTASAIKTLLKWEAPVAAIISVAMIAMAPLIISVFLGKKFEASVLLLQIMSPVFFCTAVSSIFGTLTLLPFGEQKAFTKILIGAAVLHIASLALFVPFLGAVGAAISMTSSEATIAVVMLIVILRKKLLA